jgi:tetratricopeptide (TPR) repeat protein
MNTAASSYTWYVQGNDGQPAGPFNTEQIIESWKVGRLTANTVCWHEGMANWLPLWQVEPFASTMREERRSARLRMFRRVAVGLLIIVVLAAITVIGYIWWTESTMIARANELIAAGHYEEASTLLESLAKQSYFFRRRASCLLAVTFARQFASASRAEDADDDLLADAREQFGELFAASPKWREQAKCDLAGIIGAVPSHVPGSLERSLQLAGFLSAMQLANRKQLASELLSKAKGIWADPQGGPEQAHGEAVAWIVSDDVALVDDILTAIVPDTPGVEADLDQRMACIQHWGRGWPTLAPLLSSGLAKLADELAATGLLETRHRLIATAKRIDSRFDTWSYWERYFQKADGENSRDALEILTFMVEGEQDAERLKNATDLYSDLRKRHPGMELAPPPEIRDAVNTARLHELIADIEQLVKSGQYQDARTKLDDARRRFSSVWSRDAEADRLDKEVRFHLDCETARQSFANGDLDTALVKIKDALQIRPEGKEAVDLRDKIQIATDKAEVEQHRRKAETATTTEDFRDAVDEIVKAREILEKPSNTTWSESVRSTLDRLAKTLTGKLHEQATELSDKRQYDDAKNKVRIGLRLLPKDQTLSQLLKEIEQREDDPKTMNISGIWMSLGGGEYEFKDTGGALITCQVTRLPPNMEACRGEWRREEHKLNGRFWVKYNNNNYGMMEGEVRAVIKNANTLTVFWADAKLTSFNPPRFEGRGAATWTKQQSGAEKSAMSDDAEEPGIRPPASRRAPGHSRTPNDRDLFGPRPSAPKPKKGRF